MKRRIGIFFISSTLIEDNDFHKILSKMEFVPLSVRHQGFRPAYEFIGYSSLFDLVENGIEAPTYNINTCPVENDLGEIIDIQVKVNRID